MTSQGSTELWIRRAFASGDADESAKLHDERDAAPEIHASSEAGEIVKSLVFGGLDGTMTAFAVVAAAAGAGLSTQTVILMGVANLVADGISKSEISWKKKKSESPKIRKSENQKTTKKTEIFVFLFFFLDKNDQTLRRRYGLGRLLVRERGT